MGDFLLLHRVFKLRMYVIIPQSFYSIYRKRKDEPFFKREAFSHLALNWTAAVHKPQQIAVDKPRQLDGVLTAANSGA
jgi:hypothetical protein